MNTSFPLIKLCGNVSLASVDNISPLKPDMLGFIFYRLSKRFFQEEIASLRNITHQKKVGVFVNENVQKIMDIASQAQLDFIQLHGDESVEECRQLSKNIPVIKAFGINEYFNFSLLEAYQEFVTYFLFDTSSSQFGGTGIKFPRSIIYEKYTLITPYWMSGGIDMEEALFLLNSSPKNMIGIDINSKFEISAGIKNNQMVQQLLRLAHASRI